MQVSACVLALSMSCTALAGKPATDALAEAGQREIVALHDFFQAWYRGTADDRDFRQFEAALADDFVIVVPDARILQREAIIEAVRGQRASDPGIVVEIRNVHAHRSDSDSAVFTYEEWQMRTGEPPRGLLSTVVFALDPNARAGLRWLHVHETWLPADANAAR
jgi:hypothetical protein